MIYQEESFTPEFIEEIKPMLNSHWEELANNKDIKPLDVDFELYSTANSLGHIRVLGVRDEGELVGYASFCISANLHYKSWVYAVSDVYYLNPLYRNKGLGSEFFEEIEKWLKGIGVQAMVVQDKVNHSHEKFFLDKGYSLVEQTYEKII